jgi:CHASE3 domain sensor protein
MAIKIIKKCFASFVVVVVIVALMLVASDGLHMQFEGRFL